METLQPTQVEEPKEDIVHALLERVETEALDQIEPGQVFDIFHYANK